MPTWFITGCSTGFGRELARAVLARGWNVVVTARDPAAVRDIVAGHEPTSLVLRLDVTDKGQIAEAVRQAEARFGGIDVLVNNAGYGFRSAVEEGEESEVRPMFDTNVFGLVAMTQAVLPGMRARRHGFIVNISSSAGRVGLAASGFYAATKFAVEGLSESLQREVQPLGINVMLVEPGPFRTDFAGRSLQESRKVIDDYAATSGARRKANAPPGAKEPGDPVRAVAAIIKAVEANPPPFRLVLGRIAFERIRANLDTLRQEMDAWKETSLGADYPPGT